MLAKPIEFSQALVYSTRHSLAQRGFGLKLSLLSIRQDRRYLGLASGVDILDALSDALHRARPSPALSIKQSYPASGAPETEVFED